MTESNVAVELTANDAQAALADTLQPSAKAVGKRPAMARSSESQAASPLPSEGTPGPNTPVSGGGKLTAPSQTPASTRQKRILPTRSRRGGPGVGSCDVDMVILETRKRRLENEPLIPTETKFLLSTNSTLVHAAGQVADDMKLNSSAFGRYFDRPEVQKSFREQVLIQTPEFTQLSEDASVGGRFRPRGSEEESVDTSDAAYEKRHRKYETFEKRQRLREKEKLKHEHYKLKERIDQLRAMDTSAFLALPTSALSDSHGTTSQSKIKPSSSSQVDDAGFLELPGAHVNGAAAYNEGERRRKEMLDVAMALEERYRLLLPPDRKPYDKNKARRESASLSVEPDHTGVDLLSLGEGSTVATPSQRAVREPKTQVSAKSKPALPPPPPTPSLALSGRPTSIPPSATLISIDTSAPPVPTASEPPDSEGESEVDFEERDRQRSKQLKLRIRFPPKASTSEPPEDFPPPENSLPTPAALPPPKKKSTKSKSKVASKASLPVPLPIVGAVPGAPVTTDVLPLAPPTPVKNGPVMKLVQLRAKDGKFLSKKQRVLVDPDAVSAPPPRKRARTGSSRRSQQQQLQQTQLDGTNLTSMFSGPVDRQQGIPAGTAELPSATSISAPLPPPPHKRKHVSYAGAAGHSERTGCVLMIAALRSSSTPNARKTQRHSKAFGTSVPSEIEEVRDFEIPLWLHDPEGLLLEEERDAFADGELGGEGDGDGRARGERSVSASASVGGPTGQYLNGHGFGYGPGYEYGYGGYGYENGYGGGHGGEGSVAPTTVGGDVEGQQLGVVDGDGDVQMTDAIDDHDMKEEGSFVYFDSKEDVPPIATLDDNN